MSCSIAPFHIELSAVSEGYDRKQCWVHARPGVIPGRLASDTVGVVTTQALRLTGDDVFYAINEFRSNDGGANWSGPVSHDTTLNRRTLPNGLQEGPSDFTPAWHAASSTLLGIGHTVLYDNDDLPPLPRLRSTVYSCYDADQQRWSSWRKLVLPPGKKFESEGAGSTQRYDLPNGDILLPTYYALNETVRPPYFVQHASTVLRCRLENGCLHFIEQGNDMTLNDGYGFGEPSLTALSGRFYLTLRNGTAGYVTSSGDGLHFDTPIPWCYDDGSDLGNYNTQQHWVRSNRALYLVYTRRGADNDHIPRHRAPLFIAQVDPERLCVLRATERVLVPERGARLCNFGVAHVSDRESWVVAAEWMQTTPPDPFDFRQCEARGSNNTIFLAKIRFPE